MESKKTLLIVGHKTETVRVAKSFGLNVILFQHKSSFQPEQAKLADATFVVDYRDWSVVRPLAEAVHAAWGISAALSLTEPGLEVAGRINDLFDLGGTGYGPSHLLRDKLAMRRHLAAAGAPTIAAAPVTDRDGLAAFGAEHGYPFIVKPTDLAGGFGVLRVSRPDEVDRVWKDVQRVRETGVDLGPTEDFTATDFLMEDYVADPEYSVEAFSFAGCHVVLGVTEKLTEEAHFAEMGHVLPGRVGADLEEELVRAVSDFLDVIGIKDGPSHTEVRVGRRGPIVIESHNRFGGGRIKDLVERVYGIDLIAYSVGWPFRLVEELTERPEPRGAACVRVLHGGPGRVESISGIEKLSEREEVIAVEVSAKPGEVVGPLQNNWDRLGLVAVAGPDSDAAVRLCEDLIDRWVSIEMSQE
jgi:biotin carboxylase